MANSVTTMQYLLNFAKLFTGKNTSPYVHRLKRPLGIRFESVSFFFFPTSQTLLIWKAFEKKKPQVYADTVQEVRH